MTAADVCNVQRLAAEAAQRQLQLELKELRQAMEIEAGGLRRQQNAAVERLQREVLARQTAEQELLYAKRAQESADEAAQKARLYSSARTPSRALQSTLICSTRPNICVDLCPILCIIAVC